jgi:hypothetical protein
MKTIKEIYNEIIAEKETFSSLDGLQPAADNAANLISQLSSGSKVAIWRLVCYINAVAIYSSQVVLELIRSRAAIGTLPWVVSTAKEYQHGDLLTFVNGSYIYNPIDANNQIVSNAAAIESANGVIVKVAKGTSPNLEPLSTLEFDSFKNYMSLKMIAGVNYGYINEPADTLVIGYDVFYNPLVMNSDGERISDGVKVVEVLINDFIQSLDFNGVLKLTQLTNAIKSLPEVTNVVLKFANARFGVITPIDLFAAQGQRYVPFSGYMAISTDPGEELSDTINYIPQL